MARILVIDAFDGEQLRSQLEGSRHTVRTATTGRDAKEFLQTYPFDLVVMDHCLPDMSGLLLLRTFGPLGLVMLSATADQQTKILALHLGADDFIAKPWDADVLVERVAAVLRRCKLNIPIVPATTTIGQLVISYGTVLASGKPMSISPSEHAILQALSQHVGRVSSKAELLAAVYGTTDQGAWEAITTIVWRLRRKLKAAGITNPELQTVRPLGLALRYEPAA